MMVQHNTTLSSSEAVAAKGKRGVVSSLQGPRPLPLSLPGTGSSSSSSSPPRPAKRPRVVVNGGNDDNDDNDGVRAPPPSGPVILYEYTPKVIYARPDEFKAVVQRLTGRQQRTGTEGVDDSDQHEVVLRLAQTAAAPVLSSQQEQDPLVLALGQHHVPALPLVDVDHLAPPVVLPPSPGGNFLLAPGSFLFSPATMQAFQELISYAS